MPHQNQWETNGLYRHFSGIVGSREIINANLILHGDPRFTELQYVINDFTQTKEFDATHADVTKIVAFDNVASVSNKRLKIAIIATLEPLLNWINLYLEQMKDQAYECKIFDNATDAYEWSSN